MKLLRIGVVGAEAGPAEFARVKVESGTVVWPNGADLCPDVLIWNGPPPELEMADAGKAQ